MKKKRLRKFIQALLNQLYLMQFKERFDKKQTSFIEEVAFLPLLEESESLGETFIRYSDVIDWVNKNE